MGNFRSIFHICANNFRRWISNPRYYIAIGILVIWIHFLVSPLQQFSQMVDVAITPWVMPFIFTNWYPIMFVMICVVLIFCDAPFINNGTPYECIRSGRRNWVRGQLLYVYIASFVIVLLVFLISVVCLLPKVEFTNEWGKVFNTLAQTSAGAQYSNILISYEIIKQYSPLGATCLTALILFLTTAFIGTIMLCINMISKQNGAGVLAGTFLAFLPVLGNLIFDPNIYYFIPTAWSNLDLIEISGRSMYPSIEYVLCFLVVSLIILDIVILKVHKKKEIDVVMPM